MDEEARAVYDEIEWVDERFRALAALPQVARTSEDVEENARFVAQRARVALALGLPETAERQAVAALATLIESAGPTSPQLAPALDVLTEALLAQSRCVDAAEVARRALRIQLSWHYPTHPDVRRLERMLEQARGQ